MNSGPSTQTNFCSPSTDTRQPPHMPVPSTITGFRLTVVGMFSGRVTSTTARIIGSGPDGDDLVERLARGDAAAAARR